jgi:hypothetical protein
VVDAELRADAPLHRTDSDADEAASRRRVVHGAAAERNHLHHPQAAEHRRAVAIVARGEERRVHVRVLAPVHDPRPRQQGDPGLLGTIERVEPTLVADDDAASGRETDADVGALVEPEPRLQVRAVESARDAVAEELDGVRDEVVGDRTTDLAALDRSDGRADGVRQAGGERDEQEQERCAGALHDLLGMSERRTSCIEGTPRRIRRAT